MEEKLQVPFLSSLIVSNLRKLTNDPIAHGQNWPPMPTKLPSDVPKLKVKQGENLGNHVITFHL